MRGRMDRQTELDEILSLSIEERQKRWDELESSVPPRVLEPYPVKRKKLAVAIKEIDDLINRRVWTHWPSWSKWDFMRMPITYCFECLYPARLIPTISPQGKLKMLKCEACELIHYDSKYD